MAPPFIIPTLRRKREIDGGLSCEIVSDLCPNPLSHDWHVQPSCQRPNRDPPERCEFSPDRIFLCGTGSLTRSVEQSSTPPTRTESDCPRNPTNIRAAQNPVNVRIPQNFHHFSTLEKAIGSASRGSFNRPRWKSGPFRTASAIQLMRGFSPSRLDAQKRATVWPSALDKQRRRFFGARRSGRQKIEKRTCFGGPCFEGTLQKPTSVSESSPVAGTIRARHALSNL